MRLLTVPLAVKIAGRLRLIFALSVIEVNHKHHGDRRFRGIKLSIRLIKPEVFPDIMQSAADCIHKDKIHGNKNNF